MIDKEELRQRLYNTGEKKDFVHLHLHSDFSLKDGIGKPNQYAKKAIALGMPALAITDHGSIGAHPSFFMFCKSNGIKPIVGVEAYLQDRRYEYKDVEEQLSDIDKKIKLLKQALKHKKLNKQFVNKYIEYYRKMLDMSDAEFEDIDALDFSEVKECVNNTLLKFQQIQKDVVNERDSLRKNQHIVLLAKNEQGRKNITKIVSDAARNGFYYKPRTSFDFVAENHHGIIAMSACLGGIINNVMLQYDNEAEAEAAGLEVAKQYKDVFGDDFFIEIMIIDIDRQRQANTLLVKIAKKLGIKLVITNDVHYLDKDGARAQEISLMLGSKDEVGQQVTMRDKKRQAAIKEILETIGNDNSAAHIKRVYNDYIELDRFAEFKPTKQKNKLSITLDEISDIVSGKVKFKRIWEFSTKDFWFKDRHEMVDVYIDQGHYEYLDSEIFVEALNNTIKVANMIDEWEWDTKEKLPKIELEEGKSSYDYMVEMVRDGWQRKAEDSWYEENNVYAKRVKYELSVIRRIDLADYFVIVADYIKFAKNHNILVGAGRGCFLPEVNKVKMANGTQKQIEQVNRGDKVANKFWGEAKVEEHFVYDIDEDVVELTFENKVIICTMDHRFFTRNRGEVKAIDLTEEDEILYELD